MKKSGNTDLLFVVLVVCLLGLLGFVLQVSRRQELRTAELMTRNLVQGIESRVSGDFMRISDLLEFIVRDLRRDKQLQSPLPPAGQALHSDYLAGLLANFPTLGAINIFDAKGTLRYSSKRVEKRINVADRRHFQRLRDNPGAALEFSRAQISRSTEQWSLVMAHAIRDDAGRFLGAVSAVIHLDEFSKLFARIDVGPGGATLLRRSDDFTLVQRSPRRNEKDFNQPLPETNPLRQRIASGEREGTVLYTASTDGVERIASFKALDRFPFFVQVALAKATCLAEWRRQAVAACAVAVFLFFVLFRLHRVGRTLRASEKRFRQVYEHVAVGVAQVSLEFRLERANQAYCQMLGYSEKELIGKHLKDITHPETVEENLRQQMRLSQGEIDHFRLEKSFIHKSGKTVYGILDANLVRNVRGEPHYFLGSVVDITARKQAEEALWESRSVLHAVLNAIPVRVFWKDKNLVYLGCNTAFARDAGFEEPEDIVGKDDYAMGWREQASLYRADDYSVIKSRTPRLFFEEPQTTPAGDRIHLLTSKVPLQNLKGEISGVLGAYIDITDRKRAEDLLRRTNQALEESILRAEKLAQEAQAANRSKSEFLATMSHELRTPLNGTLGMLQLLQATPLTKEQMEYVVTALGSGRNLLELLTDILDLSRIEAGKLEIVAQSFDLVESIRFVSDIYRQEAQIKGVLLTSAISEGVPSRLVGDPCRLRQILVNLVGNAVKFTRQGLIEITAEPCSSIMQTDKAHVLFTVRDTGIGIPHHMLHAVFEPFTQADGSTTRKFGGTGLGLTIVSRLASLMGGMVSLESVEGSGTTVQVSLPFSLPDEHLADDQEEVDALPLLKPMLGAPLRILVAEDDVVNRTFLQRALEMRGYVVTVAEDGEKALKFFEEYDFDCILMDIQMPVLDGIEATRAIRNSTASGDKSRIPIIALTAHAMSGDRERFLAVGMSDYLAKPVEIDALHRMLSQLGAGWIARE